MSLKCAGEACTEAAIALLDERHFCRAHFLARAYRHLESIASQIQDPQFHSEHGESAASFLEQCMRQTADMACGDPMKPWEEKTETRLVSLHGFHLECRHEVQMGSTLTCIRLDNSRRVDARVVWARLKASGETEAGLQFLTDEDFWNLETGVAERGPKI
jgi:hypothetical protein